MKSSAMDGGKEPPEREDAITRCCLYKTSLLCFAVRANRFMLRILHGFSTLHGQLLRENGFFIKICLSAVERPADDKISPILREFSRETFTKRSNSASLRACKETAGQVIL